MWWFGVFFERLSLDIVERGIVRTEAASDRPGSDRPAPIAVCSRLHVLDADDAACDQGIVAGMKRAAAQALVPALVLRERDVGAERITVDSMAAWMQQFTPSVSVQSDLAFGALDETISPCGLLAEVGPSLRYFGGSAKLLARVRAGLRESGFRVRIGAAPTPTAAWLFARHRDGLCADERRLESRVGALPVALLARTRVQRETLQAIDVQHVRDLLALPRAAVARRLGRTVLDEVDRALGHLPDPRGWFETPPGFDHRIELLAHVEHAEALVFAARRLLHQLVGWLAARHGAIRAFTLHLEHDEHEETLLEIRLADPTRDPERLITLLREKLAVTRLPEAAHALRLRCGPVVALPDASGQLFPAPDTAHENLRRLIERLQVRLGAGHVQRLRLAADHRPEAAYRIEAADAAGSRSGGHRTSDRARRPDAHGARSPQVPPACLPRPLWLLGQPVALSERNNRPWWHSPLRLLAGPERIEAGWWDGALVQRDYFIAEDETHTLYWIFRERLSADSPRRGWFLHGRFG